MENSSIKKNIMKRLSFIAFVMVVLAAWIVPGYSVDVNWDAQYRVRAITVDNPRDFNKDAGGDHDGWIDQRFRLGIKLTEAPVSGYVQLQMGGFGPNDSRVWGSSDQTLKDTDGNSIGSVTGNSTSVIFRQAYLDFPVGPVGIRAGRTYASHGFLAGGMFENIADRYIISYKVSDELSGNFIHAKAREGSCTSTATTVSTGLTTTTGGCIDTTATTTATATTGATSASANDNDRNIYNLGATWKPKASPFDLGVRIYYVRDGAQAFRADNPTTATDEFSTTAAGTWDAFWLTAQSNIKLNPINIYVSAAFLTGKSDVAATSTVAAQSNDISGHAIHLDVNATPGPFKVGLVAGLGSGDKDKTDNKFETFFAPGGASYIQSHIFFQNGENTYATSILSTGKLNTQNGKLETLSNITWYGLYGDFKAIPDKLTLGAKVAIFKQTEALTGTSDSIGNELDLTANYMIHKNLSLLAFAAWFMPDDGITGGGAATDDTVTEYFARLQWEFN